jgi:hypothetical protein
MLENFITQHLNMSTAIQVHHLSCSISVAIKQNDKYRQIIILHCRPTKMGAETAQSVWRLEQENFLRHKVHTASGAYQTLYPISTGVIFSGVNRPGREYDHSPSSSAEIKNAWSYTPLPNTTTSSNAMLSTRDNFPFLIFYITNRYNI